jgi:hypothetical protein
MQVYQIKDSDGEIYFANGETAEIAVLNCARIAIANSKSIGIILEVYDGKAYERYFIDLKVTPEIKRREVADGPDGGYKADNGAYLYDQV